MPGSSTSAIALDGKQLYHRVTWPSEGVMLLEFNRAPVNAFHEPMWRELQSIIEAASTDSRVRAIVLASANEKVFTAGLDISDNDLLSDHSTDPARAAFKLHEHIIDFQSAISSLARTRPPVIAAIHGTSLGLALDIVSACDIRISAENTTFAIAEVNVGLAADIGTLQRLPKIIGNDSLARELALTGRKFSAVEAKDMGLISRVIPGGRQGVIDEALKIAREIASKSPVAVVSTKHLMNHARDHSVEEGLRYTAAWNMSMLQSDDVKSAMKATLARKSVTFPPIVRESKL